MRRAGHVARREETKLEYRVLIGTTRRKKQIQRRSRDGRIILEKKIQNNRLNSERSKAGTVYDRLNIWIAVSNPAWGLDVCPRVSVLCCPVSVEALHRADPPAKYPYQMSLYVDREAH
jgi:hypothetical protein